MGVLMTMFILMIFNGKWMWELRFWSLMLFSLFCLKFLNIDMSGSMEYMFLVDKLSGILVLLSLWTVSLMMLSSYYSVKINNNKKDLFSFNVFILCLVIILFFLVDNMLMFYLFFEVSLIPTLLLVLGWGYQPERLQAGMYMMLYTITASLPLLVSVVFLSSYKMTYMMSELKFMWFDEFGLYWFIGLFLAFLVKLPMYFFHLWLPKAHVEAPISGSMILASVLLKLGGYGVVRFLSIFNCFFGKFYMMILMIICLWGGLLTSLICIGQSDMKSLIAYSSVGHMGVMLGGLISGSVVGLDGGVLMMVSHGLCSSGLFCVANLVYEKINSRSLFLLGGLININPLLSLVMFILCISNMGAPPFINLISEVMLFISLFMYSWLLLVFILFMVFMSGLYNLLFYVNINHGQVMSFIKVLYNSKSSEMLLLLLHIMPLLLFMFNVGLISKIYL